MIKDYKNRLKLILQRNNISIADFCRIIGLNSTGTIHKLISDNRKPSSKTVDRIIAAFPDVTEDWLLYGRGSYEVTPNQKTLEDELTVTAKQVIDFIKKNNQKPLEHERTVTANKVSNYSDRIKQIIHKNRLNISDFSRIIGLNSPTTVHLIIKNNRKPSSKTVDRIIAAFPEVTKDWLLYGRGSYGVSTKQNEKIEPIEIDNLEYAESELRHISLQLKRFFEFSRKTERESVEIIDRMINDLGDLLLIKITKYNTKIKNK